MAFFIKKRITVTDNLFKKYPIYPSFDFASGHKNYNGNMLQLGENDILVMEIEDTGDGMPESEVERLNDSMNNALIDDLKKNDHIGVINACIRLKMKTDNQASFGGEREEGVGTFTVIKVPLSSISEVLEGENNES